MSGASDFAADIATCPIRYVLSDELTRLCAALAFSKGAHTFACADLIRVPAQRLWIEWAYAPWHDELRRYGFPRGDLADAGGRRGALVNASDEGRRGSVRTFWCLGDAEADVLASPLQAQFDLDASEGAGEHRRSSSAIRVADHYAVGETILSDCFAFNYEDTWRVYYDQAQLPANERQRIERHSLGTIALDIPLLLAFFLMLNTRSGLPQEKSRLEKLNRARARNGKPALLEHIDIRAPFPWLQMLPDKDTAASGRRGRRLHHVRGHIVRRRNEIFWRVPHLRGQASVGVVRSRTVTWAFDRGS